MTQSGGSRSWPYKLTVAFGIGGAMMAFSGNCTLAQIKPDTTLGAETSVLKRNVLINRLPSDRIEGGAKRGANLFHSFERFNIDEGRGAYFINPAGIKNILSRVTGNSRSEIEGTLGVLGKANLFLINPKGIIFGPNASLDVNGSFVATTADAIQFDNQGFFSTSEPNSPPLLTVNPSAFLFNQMAHGSIENSSIAPAGKDPSGAADAIGLRVPDGQSLLLLGGDITMNNGGLYAFGGRVELGGVTGAGTVGLNGSGNNLSLSFPNSVARSDVSLSNDAVVGVIAGDGGSIAVNARDLEMTGESVLVAGIGSGLGSNNSRAGNIKVNTTGAINLNNSDISNLVRAEASGQAGNVSISASTLQLESGAQVSAITSGKGKGGNLTVDAQDVQLIGTSADPQFPSALSASAQPNSTGDAGDLTINTNTLLVQDGAQVSAATFGKGKGGNLRVDAQDVQLIGASADGRLASALGASAESNSTGDAGDLTINTNTLLVKDGAQVGAATFGKGKGGNLRIDAQDVQLIGRSADGRFPSALTASAESNSTGDAGDLTLNTNTLLVQDGAQVSAGTFGKGKGGNLSVDAQDVRLIDASADGRFASSLTASAQPNSTGDAGDLTINTNTLLVQDGAQVSAGTFSKGKGGSLTIDAQDVQVIGRSADLQFPSVLSASTQPNSTGDAGDLTLNTNTLLVQDGAQVSTGTFGKGKGGDLTVGAQDVQLIGRSADGQFASGLFASTQPNSTGDAGDLTLNTNTLLVQDGARVSVASRGTGTAGIMALNARSIRLDDNAFLTANTQSTKIDSNSEQATININSEDLIMRRGSNIRTNATGKGVIGGNINIDNTDLIVGLENSDITANSLEGKGGIITIKAQGIFGLVQRDLEEVKALLGTDKPEELDPSQLTTSDITAISQTDPTLSGQVTLNTPDVDPSQGLVALPEEVVDVSGLIAQTCPAGSGPRQSKFVVTGRGGLPPNPGEILSTDAVQVDLVTLNPKLENRSSPDASTNLTSSSVAPIVEAQGWVRDAKGNVVLTANAPTAKPHSFWGKSAKC